MLNSSNETPVASVSRAISRGGRKVLLRLVLISGLAAADTLTGEILGRVVDIEGSLPLAEATVTLTSDDRGWERKFRTDAEGEYRFVQLAPGSYAVSVEKDGYYRSERTGVLVRLNQPKVVLPPFELRRTVSTPTRQVATLKGEQTKTVVIDLTAPVPTSAVLAIINEPGKTGLASLLDPALRFNFDARTVGGLPLRGARSFDQLALLAPGVFRVPASSGSGPAVGVGVGSGGQFSVNGMRARSNNFTVDGSDNNDEDIGVRRQGFVALVPQSNEAIGEFQVMTSGFPAEFGRNAGSMANAVSRAGTREPHGSVYGFLDHDRLAARDFFDHELRDERNSASLSGGSFRGKDHRRAQYGGVLGGPMVPGRAFFFLSGERQHYEGSALGHFMTPLASERGLRTRTGFVPVEQLDAFLADQGADYSNRAGLGLFSLYPLPNNPSGPFGAYTYSQAAPRSGEALSFSARTDWRFGSVHDAFARFNQTGDDSLLPFTGDSMRSSLATETHTKNLSLFLNSAWARRANALRLSYGRTRLAFPAGTGSPLVFGSAPNASGVSTGVIDTPYGRFGPFGATGPIGQLSVLPYSSIGIDVFNFPQQRVDNTFQFSDSVTWTGPRHTVKAGIEIRRSQLNSRSDRNSRPLVLFSPGRVSRECLADPFCPFATDDGLLRSTDLVSLGAPAGLLQAIGSGPAPDSTLGLRFSQLDAFAQDEWRLSRRLTLQVGLRYELPTVPGDVNGRIERTFGLRPEQFGRLTPSGNLQDRRTIQAGNLAFDNALEALQQFIGGRKGIYRPTRRNFAPRIGLAWDPNGSGRQVIRAGYGLVYDASLGAVTSQSRNVFPTFAPVNLDLNFRPPDGRVLNSPVFLRFLSAGTPLIRPGTLNSYNLTGDAFATGFGTLFAQAPPLPGGDLSSNGLAFTLPEESFRTAYAQQFSASVERQFGEDHLVALSYAGTLGSHLMRFTTPNGGPMTTPVLLSSFAIPLAVLDIPPGPPSGNGRPDTSLGAYTVFASSAPSNYHSMQISVERRYSGGLQARGSWTWSHAIDEVSDPFDQRGFFSLPQDTARLRAERASANFDARHRVTAHFLWEPARLPGLRALEGWTVSGVVELQTGQPYTVNSATDRNQDGNLTDRPDTLAGFRRIDDGGRRLLLEPGIPPSSTLAAQGKSGRVGRNPLRADGIASFDVALSRTLTWTERVKMDLRLELFNAFNRTHFGTPVRILESPGFGRSFDTQLDARSARLSAKVVF